MNTNNVLSVTSLRARSGQSLATISLAALVSRITESATPEPTHE